MTPAQRETAGAVADTIADRLAAPADAHSLPLPQGWWPQSLAHGAAGIALLHIERARAGLAPWHRADDWLACAAAGQTAAGPDSHLHYGAPALAYALHVAAGTDGRYTRALAALDDRIARAARMRLAAAHARMDRAEHPALAEFDAIRGLTGIGAHLLHRDPHGELAAAVLAYLIRLTEPAGNDGGLLPGWWTSQAPSGRPSPRFPGGHANNGMAHGIGGPLALLSLAAIKGVTVPGMNTAITRICAWLDQWRQDDDGGHWWPYWVTPAQLRDGTPGPPVPSRPSWCYGTAGLARAQQLAAIATGDQARQHMAELALARALSAPRQLATISDRSLCHGFAGLLHIAGRAAADAAGPQARACRAGLLSRIIPGGMPAAAVAASVLESPGGGPGLLEGAAGIALALHAVRSGMPAEPGWDSCLLIS
jgi:hypothetical protein